MKRQRYIRDKAVEDDNPYDTEPQDEYSDFDELRDEEQRYERKGEKDEQ